MLLSFPACADDQLTRIDIADPVRYWEDNGFVEMHAPIRPSVVAGKTAQTKIFLYVPADQLIQTQYHEQTRRYTLKFPPGSVADRVSFRLYKTNTDNIGQTIDDVRGTRWGRTGREYFHVYRPTGVAPDTPLLGYEWPRDNPAMVEAATHTLTAQVAKAPQPIAGGLPSKSNVRRFRSLNNCAACHIANKPVAVTGNARLPPWPTDASGLYVPSMVLLDHAPLSNTGSFHDPNVNDAYISASCGDSAARIRSAYYADWFHCTNNAMPIGVRDMRGGLRGDDRYTRAVCDSRRYLYARLDQTGRQVFAEAFRVCGIV